MGVVKRIREIFLRKTRENETSYFADVKKRFSSGGQLLDVGGFIRRAVRLHSNNVALIGRERSITYRELYARSLSIAGLLAEKYNVQARDKVVLYCENSLEFYIFYYAVWLRGAIVVPVNSFLHEKEFGHILKEAKPAAILTLDRLRDKLNDIVKKGFVNALPPIVTDEDIDWAVSVPRDIRLISDKFIEDAGFNIDEMCLLLYTSGTTGVSKGVMLSSRNVIINAMQDYSRLRLFSNEHERFFAVLPLFHVFAQNTCMWLPMLTGSSVIVVQKIDRRYILEGLNKKPTLFFGFPALYGLLCIMKDAPLESIKRFVSGADAMPDKIRSAFAMIYGRKICAGYGLTEASPVVAINHDNENLPTNAVGRPLVGISCEIRDEDGKVLGNGKTGTLWLKGDNIMLGYYKSPEATAQVLKDGWLSTGDLASFDEDGNLLISGRSKDLIVHKGFNIYPQEVENVLMSHPAVFKAAVIGKDEAIAGQVPIAFVAVRGDKEMIEKSLMALCKDNLATYKIPRKFICLDDLPMNSTGKVDKKQLNQV